MEKYPRRVRFTIIGIFSIMSWILVIGVALGIIEVVQWLFQ